MTARVRKTIEAQVAIGTGRLAGQAPAPWLTP